MSFGKLYGFQENPRTTLLLVIAKENGLDVTLEETRPGSTSADYTKTHPLGKIPAFVGANGFVLHEVIAIAVYFASQNEKTTLLGKTKEDYASILKWMSFSNSELIGALGAWFRPLLGRDVYNKKNVDTAIAQTKTVASVFEAHLLKNTFLVTEKLTLADIFATSVFARGFQYVLDAEFRAAYPNIVRWYELIRNQPLYSSVAGEVSYIQEAIKYTPPKKEAAPKAAPKPAAPKAEKPAKEEEEEEEAPAAPKPKHPLDALPKPTLILDDWKRKYSNEDTRTGALPWFWEHYKPEESSLWKVDYKYNDELTQVFMTSNLIGGFFNRLEASRKHLFGALSVYGESNNSIVTGAFLVRGQEDLPAFDVAPDYESYSFTKLDPSKPEDKEFIEDQWTWDKDYQGKKWADGKVFK